MEQELTKEEADRRAREVAHRLLTTPPKPRSTNKRETGGGSKPARFGSSKPKKPWHAGEAS
jgi:hypothetical protein